jgi:ribonuclease P protein component
MQTGLSETGRFRRNERIKRPVEIHNLFKCGKRASVQGAKLFYAQNHLGFNRIGFPLPRKYGSAVERNLSKRLSREVYRIFKTHLNTGYDMLLLVYPGNDSFHSRCDQFRALCEKALLLKE